MMKSIGFIACFITLTCLLAATARADVAKRQFASDIQAYMIKTMTSYPKSSVPPPDKKLVAERAAAFAKTIDFIPTENIDDATAKWIRESIGYFIVDPEMSYSKEANYSGVIESLTARFKVLTPQKAAEWLALRDKEIKSAKVYRAEYLRWLASKLSKVKLVEVQFQWPIDQFAKVSNLRKLRLEAFVFAMGYPSYFSAPYDASKSVNMASSPIESQLLTHALAYTVKQEIRYHIWYDEKVIKNITSRRYSDDREVDELKSFKDTLPDLEKLSEQCLVQKQETLVLNYEAFQDMIWDGYNMRSQKEYKHDRLLAFQPSFTITYANNAEAWELLAEAKMPE